MEQYLNVHIGQIICQVLDCSIHNIDIHIVSLIIHYLDNINIPIPTDYTIYYELEKINYKKHELWRKNPAAAVKEEEDKKIVKKAKNKNTISLCTYCNLSFNNIEQLKQHVGIVVIIIHDIFLIYIKISVSLSECQNAYIVVKNITGLIGLLI